MVFRVLFPVIVIHTFLFILVHVTSLQPDLSTVEHTLPSCCDRNIDISKLIQIANRTVPYHKDIARPVPFGPSIQIGIVSYATKNIWNYAAYAMAINSAYAEYNGYTLTILDESSGSFEDSDSRWNKVAILERALNPIKGWAQDMDYLVWIDADLVFLDFSFRLESVVSEARNPKAHIFVSAGKMFRYFLCVIYCGTSFSNIVWYDSYAVILDTKA